jgi:hypothetical protein
MITLTTPVPIPNVQRWEVDAFDLKRGTVTLRFYFGSGQDRWVDIGVTLSDTANASSGVMINPTPRAADDSVVGVTATPLGGGMGAVNSRTNARNAYATGYAAAGGGNNAKHNAGLKAVEIQGITDGWVGTGLGGT